MLNFCIKTDAKTGEKYLVTSLHGKALLSVPQLSKGTAFSFEERLDFGIMGKLPVRIETLEDQVTRCYEQCTNYDSALGQNVYLHSLHNRNQILFYKLISEHLEEFIPVIYTPTVGDAVIHFSNKYRQVARGIYMSYPERDYVEHILDNRANPEVDIVCITDGEAVLGIGDQGIGGMDIPIAKLMVYSLCGGINPNRVIPMTLDAGTNNKQLLDSPDYLGWKHERLTGEEYDEFVERVVCTIRKKLPNAFIHWEDFGTVNARRILERYNTQFCTFNDDIQGTGITALATILSATKALGQKLTEQRIVIFGAGAAGTGIADQIVDGLMACGGLSEEQAHRCFWLIDREGLVTEASENIHPSHVAYARPRDEWQTWYIINESNIILLEVVSNVKPTILIGCSAQAGAFNEPVVKAMASHVEHPIILPLSNPTVRSEAKPSDLIRWTDGKALIATGSPFPPVDLNGKMINIAQCNNARAFPGIGLGVLVAKPKLLSKGILLAAAHALAECSPAQEDLTAPLLPSINDSEASAKHIAAAVAKQAVKESLSDVDLNTIEQVLDEVYWKPKYLPYRREK